MSMHLSGLMMFMTVAERLSISFQAKCRNQNRTLCSNKSLTNAKYNGRKK
jgi:hypothetical protein